MVRYSLRHAPDPRPALVVQTCERADEATLREFRDLLYGLGCSGGLLFDPTRCLVVRDTFASMGPESLVVEKELPTDAVLSKMERPGQPRPRSLDRRVGLWLDVLASRWQDALPDAPEIAAPFIMDVVPAAAQAVISAEDLAA
jgi:hypothetical protein